MACREVDRLHVHVGGDQPSRQHTHHFGNPCFEIRMHVLHLACADIGVVEVGLHMWLNRLGLLAKPALPDGGVGSPSAKAGGGNGFVRNNKNGGG